MNGFTLDENSGIVTISFSEDLVSQSVEKFRRRLKSLLLGDIKTLIIDLKNVEMIDSMGIGLLVSTHTSLEGRGASLELKNLSEDLLDLFQVMRLDDFFRIGGIETN